MNVLAIDPGTLCGYAHSAGAHGVWRFDGHVHPGGPASFLIDSILDLSQRYGIDKIIVEGSYPVSRHGADKLEWMRGAVAIAAFRLGSVPVRVVAPSSLKLYAVGNGRAEKPAMIQACIKLCGIVPEDSNHADSLLLLHMERRNKPADRISLPAKPRKKNKKVPTQAEAYRASDEKPRKKSADKDAHLFPF